MKIKKKIVLIGMMGSGKSTIGALLSKKLNRKFIDIDNKDEAEAYLIADNRLTELGGWIDDKLINSLEHILKQTGTLDGTGWDLEDVDDLIQDLEEPINVDDEEIAVKVGKYKLKVSKQSYDEWLIQVQKQVGKEKDDILDWIAEQLHIGRL